MERNDETLWPCTNQNRGDGGVHQRFRRSGPDRSGTDGRREDTERADGPNATACPDCTAATVNVQGLHSCVECGWTGSR